MRSVQEVYPGFADVTDLLAVGLGERLFGEPVDLACLDTRETEFFANRGDQSERIRAVGANSYLWITHEAKGSEETDALEKVCKRVAARCPKLSLDRTAFLSTCLALR